MLNNAGYEAGVYTYRHFFQDYLNVSALERYSIWLADYIKENTIQKENMISGSILVQVLYQE